MKRARPTPTTETQRHRGSEAAIRSGSQFTVFTLLAGVLLLVSGCTPRHDRIVIGSKNFTEQAVLGELLAQYLEARGMPVERRFYLAGTYVCQQALLAGRIDLYVEYTGTALTAILKEPPSSDSAAVYRRVRDEFRRRFGFVVTKPLGFNNSFAIIIRGQDARRYGVQTLTQAARFTPQWHAGFGYEFMERRDGFQGLAATYGLRFADAPRIMDLGLLYRALQSRQVDLIAGAATDGLIPALDLTVLADDKHYFPPYDAVPVVRQDTLQRFPQLESALDELGGKITERDMQQMNYAVDKQKRDPQEVAKEFLRRQSLVASR